MDIKEQQRLIKREACGASAMADQLRSGLKKAIKEAVDNSRKLVPEGIELCDSILIGQCFETWEQLLRDHPEAPISKDFSRYALAIICIELINEVIDG